MTIPELDSLMPVYKVLQQAHAKYDSVRAPIMVAAERLRGRQVVQKATGKKGKVIGTWPDHCHALLVSMADASRASYANPSEFGIECSLCAGTGNGGGPRCERCLGRGWVDA